MRIVPEIQSVSGAEAKISKRDMRSVTVPEISLFQGCKIIF